MVKAKSPKWLMLGSLPVVPGAACRGYPVPLWDNWLDGESRTARAARHRRAVEVCQGCPATRACAQAREESGSDGVWAGMVFDAEETPQGGPVSSMTAVEACLRGERPAEALTRQERYEVVRRLHAQGLTDAQIAERTRLQTYTTSRIRGGLGLPANRVTRRKAAR